MLHTDTPTTVNQILLTQTSYNKYSLTLNSYSKYSIISLKTNMVNIPLQAFYIYTKMQSNGAPNSKYSLNGRSFSKYSHTKHSLRYFYTQYSLTRLREIKQNVLPPRRS